MVTIKIYDILGNEKTTLVNEHKNTGKYNINFDAGNLASGVYTSPPSKKIQRTQNLS